MEQATNEMGKEEDAIVSNLRETRKTKDMSESWQIGTGQNISWCKQLGEDAVCVPISVMSTLIEKLTWLLRPFPNKKQTC